MRIPADWSSGPEVKERDAKSLLFSIPSGQPRDVWLRIGFAYRTLCPDGVNDFYEYRPNYNKKPKNPASIKILNDDIIDIRF